MSVLGTFTELCSIVGDSSGIVSCPTVFPTALNSGDLPLALIIPGEASWNEHAVGLYRQERTYMIRVYVKPVGQGKGVDEGVQACLAPMNALGRTLLVNHDLNGTVDQVIQPFNDSGVLGDMAFAEVPYHGFEFTIRVVEKST